MKKKELSKIARELYKKYPHDGKFVLDKERLIVCQSKAITSDLQDILPKDTLTLGLDRYNR